MTREHPVRFYEGLWLKRRGLLTFLQSRCGYRSDDCRNACFRPVTEQLNLLDSRRSDAEACIRRRKLPLIPSIF
jgi:hypothetical protein